MDAEDRTLLDLVVREVRRLSGGFVGGAYPRDRRLERLGGRSVERPGDRPGTGSVLLLELLSNIKGQGRGAGRVVGIARFRPESVLAAGGLDQRGDQVVQLQL